MAATRKPVSARTAPRKPRARVAPAAKRGSGLDRASIGALVAAAVGAVAFGLYRLATGRPAEGTEPTDLMGGIHPDGSGRAPDAFRPDPTAPVPAAERAQFRPALAISDS